MDHYRLYLANYAKGVLDDGGRKAMAANMENLSDQVKFHAPVLFNHLRRSGHPVVTLGGVTVYDREPEVHRLTEEQLRQQNRLLWPTYPDALKGWIYWNKTLRGKAGIPPIGSGWAAHWKKRGR